MCLIISVHILGTQIDEYQVDGVVEVLLQACHTFAIESDAVKTTRHVNTFLIDLQDYVKSESSSRYYFGHFLFEEKNETCFGIIDGQQRLTTITIFLAALFNRLKEFPRAKENTKKYIDDRRGRFCL